MSNIVFIAVLGAAFGSYTLYQKFGNSLEGFRDVRNLYPIAILAGVGAGLAAVFEFLKRA
jgi:hypothetical protein